MHLVERMTISPQTCLVCGKGNTPDAQGNIGPFLDLERDVNWGDATYLCMMCVEKCAVLCDFVTRGQLEEVEAVIKARDNEIHNLKAEHDSTVRRLKAIIAGKTAAKSVRKRPVGARTE